MSAHISVIIPVYNDAGGLFLCLASLRASVEAPLEYIVVDDGSTDGSGEVARKLGARVLTTGGRNGPACARNIGAKAARGDVLLFVDADVCVHSDTVSKIRQEFDNDPSLDAALGSYDNDPSRSHFISQYRNLLHCYVHQSSPREASTFWAGCGAIRKTVFLEFGGFDEVYRAPAIEDIELGYRMARANRKLILCPEIQVKHLKHWTLKNMLRTDFMYRAVPWSELSLRSGSMPNTLSLRFSQRISVALVFLATLMAAYLTVRWHVYFLVPLFASFFLLLSGYWIKGLDHEDFKVTTIMGGMLAVIAGFAYWIHTRSIIPLLAIAALGLYVRHRYEYSAEGRRNWTSVWMGGYCLLAAVSVWLYFPGKLLVLVLFLILLILVALNQQFYLFLAAKRGGFFALSAIPFHLLYFFSSGVAFLLVSIKFHMERIFGPPLRYKGGPGKEAIGKVAAP